MQKGLWKKLLLVFLPIAVMLAMAYLDPNVADIGDVVMQVEPFWFVLAVLCIVAYYLLDSLMYMLGCKFMGSPQSFGESILTTMYGFFYSALTPFASGGQPMQVLQMRRRGIKVGVGTSVLALKFFAWQFTVTLLGVLGFFFVSGDVIGNNVTLFVMFCIGFLIYLGSVVLAFLVFFRPDWVRRAGEGLLGFLTRCRLLKKKKTIEHVHEVWARTIRDFKGAVHFAFQHKLGMLMIFFVCFLEAFAYMGVTYFVYRGLGFSAYSIFYVVLLQGLLYIAVSFMPLPGASIASEGGFYIVFAKLFTPAARFPAVVLWRLLTYYSALLFGVVAIIVDGVRNPVKIDHTQTDVEAVHGAVQAQLEDAQDDAQSNTGG